jgi:hypothetical protein
MCKASVDLLSDDSLKNSEIIVPPASLSIATAPTKDAAPAKSNPKEIPLKTPKHIRITPKANIAAPAAVIIDNNIVFTSGYEIEVGEIVPVEIFDKDEYSLIGEAV